MKQFYILFLYGFLGFELVKAQTLCITTHCFLEMGQCILDSRCREIIMCLQTCTPDDAGCPFICAMMDQNPKFKALLKCMVENECMPKYADDGICLATDDQALQTLTDLEQVQGDWWVLKGKNCGQDEVWRGGADWLPCQHGRFVQVENQDWINNTTFCYGKDSQCQSDYIVTIPKISLSSPGVVRHDYPDTEAPITPQIEDWKFVAYPDPDWALVIWCGNNPVITYNGAFIISRHQTLSMMSPEIENEFRIATAKYGLDFDEMCISDNTKCEV